MLTVVLISLQFYECTQVKMRLPIRLQIEEVKSIRLLPLCLVERWVLLAVLVESI